MSSKDDPHTGGSLSDMAVTGTKIPNDAGKQNLIPSVPRPDQIADAVDNPNSLLGSRDLAGAADNPIDISRTTKDKPRADDILTGTGDTLPAEAGIKRLHVWRNEVASKGNLRYDKYVKQKGSDQERGAGKMPGDDEIGDGVVGG